MMPPPTLLWPRSSAQGPYHCYFTISFFPFLPLPVYNRELPSPFCHPGRNELLFLVVGFLFFGFVFLCVCAEICNSIGQYPSTKDINPGTSLLIIRGPRRFPLFIHPWENVWCEIMNVGFCFNLQNQMLFIFQRILEMKRNGNTNRMPKLI